jgi:hypothetical protein
MSIRQKLLKAIQNLWKQILQLSRSITQRLKNWLLRTWLVLGRRSRFSSAGFVLPTVVMVILVVVLVTTAMVFRSFDRAKNASNVRVSQRVLAAAGPAIDRAQAKINALLADPTLPRGTPTDQTLYNTMAGTADLLKKYTLGDETPLKLAYDADGRGGIKRNPRSLDEDETLTTAWRFPIDTDNDGSFDSYTLYGLYFRNPTTSANRGRSPLEARSTPMDNASAGNTCGAGTSASLVGSGGWYKTSDGNIKRSFFVFALTVPITTPQRGSTNEKPYSGNKAFTALEFQEDIARIPLTNNAVVYDDDLEITPGAGIRLNGRIMTNGNLMIGQGSNPVEFYQVSSTESCFYSEENGKITVGGNVVLGSADSTRTSLNPVKVHLFESGAKPSTPSFARNNGSVSNPAVETSYNSTAYAERINYLVQKTTAPPPLVQKKVSEGVDRNKALQDYFKERTRRVPFKEVPDGTRANALRGAVPPGPRSSNDMRPLTASWIYPADLTSGASLNNLALQKDQPPAKDPEKRNPDKEEELGDRILVGNGLPAKWWDPESGRFIDFYDQQPQSVDGTGNNTKWTGSDDTYRTRMTQVVTLSDLGDTTRDGFWERKAAEQPEQSLDAVGGLRVVTGAGVYSRKYSFLPEPSSSISPIADDPSTLEKEPQFTVVLPDSMPMWQDTDDDGKPELPPFGAAVIPPTSDRIGDLVMRATAVYHYRYQSYDDPPPNTGPYQTPLACVSSYYDPTTKQTAKNRQGLPDISLRDPNLRTPFRALTAPTPVPPGAAGLSNNGVSYRPPSKTAGTISGIGSYDSTTGRFAAPPAAADPANRIVPLGARLSYQANLIFPNGRFVNEPLRQALIKVSTRQRLNLAEQAAIDSTICALEIADKSIGSPTDSRIPHGAIYETAFLDARQVKAIDETPIVTADYNLPIEERQPLEIRATVLNLDLLRRKPQVGTLNRVPSPVPAPEYLLPDSGIIYATRDDALPDLSDKGDVGGTAEVKMAARKINSPVDFRLDPTRRPNGIMLINGNELARGGNANLWKKEEKGLILASNLPVYVKADQKGFNLHQTPRGAIVEEFREKLATRANWDETYFYTGRRNRETQFACRANQPGLNCTPGDLWRPATVIADAVTLLSKDFRFGFRNEGDYDLRKNVENLNNNLVLKEKETDDNEGGYDLNGSTTIETTPLSLNERNFGLDLNGDGDATDPVVTLAKGESAITATLARRINGFFDNNYLTSANWFNPTTGFPKDFEPSSLYPTGQQGSSYVNNFVTPIQRRTGTTRFPEYVMEICPKRLVSQCKPEDWVVYVNGLPKRTTESGITDILGQRVNLLKGTAAKAGSGTTVDLPTRLVDQLYPRRVAFKRKDDNTIIRDANGAAVPLGITTGGTVAEFEFPRVPRKMPNALWFKTSSNATDPTRDGTFDPDEPLFYQTPLETRATTQQPLLVPVLQLQSPEAPNRPPLASANLDEAYKNNWMQAPLTPRTTFNLLIAAGDSPTRPKDFLGAPVPEFNGGMPNFPTLLEAWKTAPGGTEAVSQISGSFIQIKRSAYATAPYLSLLTTSAPGGPFRYPQKYQNQTSGGKSPYYYASKRDWGFDVALLPQLPDLFSQLITTPSAGEPNKFYREVSQDDPWVKTLLCAAAPSGGVYNIYAVTNGPKKPTGDCPPLASYR